MNAGWGLWPRISWNPPDFTLKSGGFHLWNPAEFTQISSMKSTQNYKSKCFSKNSSVWWMQGGGYDQGFHEICMKSAGFHEICWISPEIQRISCGFHVKSKDLLQGIVTLCFVTLASRTVASFQQRGTKLVKWMFFSQRGRGESKNLEFCWCILHLQSSNAT